MTNALPRWAELSMGRTKPVRVTKKARAAAEMVLGQWKKFVDLSEGDPWYHRETRQAYQDALLAMKTAGLINDYNLEHGIV